MANEAPVLYLDPLFDGDLRQWHHLVPLAPVGHCRSPVPLLWRWHIHRCCVLSYVDSSFSCYRGLIPLLSSLSASSVASQLLSCYSFLIIKSISSSPTSLKTLTRFSPIESDTYSVFLFATFPGKSWTTFLFSFPWPTLSCCMSSFFLLFPTYSTKVHIGGVYRYYFLFIVALYACILYVFHFIYKYYR